MFKSVGHALQVSANNYQGLGSKGERCNTGA